MMKSGKKAARDAVKALKRSRLTIPKKKAVRTEKDLERLTRHNYRTILFRNFQGVLNANNS